MVGQRALLSGASQCFSAVSKRSVVISAPPQNKLSLAEKLAHGGLMMAGMLAIPIYVLVNLKHWNGVEQKEGGYYGR